MSSLSWKCLLQKQSFQWVCSQTLTHLRLSPAQLCRLSGGSETKQTETAQLENCRNLLSESRMQPQTRIRIWFWVRRALPSPAPCSRGHCRGGSEACFCFFPASHPAACPRYPFAIRTFSLSLFASHSLPLSPPFRLWSCFPLIEISLHTERT